MPEKFVIAFETEKEQAEELFLKHFSKRKFTPIEFIDAARHGQIEKVYFPARLFACELESEIEAECTKMQGEEAATVTVRRKLSSRISDILLPSCRSVDKMLLSLLEPYDLEKAQRLDEVPQSDPEDISEKELAEEIQKIARQAAESEAQKSLREFKSSKIIKLTPSFKSISQTQILLPMWVLTCEYKHEQFQLFVNGQSGKAVGIPPNSKSKIAAITAAGAVFGAALGEIIYLIVRALL